MPVHGKTSVIHHDDKTIYQSLLNLFPATHYHSLIVEAEEAFITNSILELMPLPRFENKLIGTGKPGRLTRELMAAYRKLVDEALREASFGKIWGVVQSVCITHWRLFCRLSDAF